MKMGTWLWWPWWPCRMGLSIPALPLAAAAVPAVPPAEKPQPGSLPLSHPPCPSPPRRPPWAGLAL